MNRARDTMMAALKTLAEQIADLVDPAPKDFDPEDEPGTANDNGQGQDEDENSKEVVDEDAGREHYETVGKSKLRQRDGVELGPQYVGRAISREAMMEDDYDDPFPDSEEEDDVTSESENLDDSKQSTVEDEESVSSEEEEDHRSESSSPPPTAPKSTDRAALRALMTNSTSTLSQNLAISRHSDVVKGQAIKQQRRTFDELLNVRIKLQKALIATNTIETLEQTDDEIENESKAALEKAENAALKLWVMLDSLRSSLPQPSPSTKSENSNLLKRKRMTPLSPVPTSATSSTILWNHMQETDALCQTSRHRTLTKWSNRLTPIAPPSTTNKLNPSLSSNHQLPLMTMLQTYLQPPSSERLIKRARTARSCAPVQASQPAASSDGTSPGIYDDADFYTQLLRELVSSRMSSQFRDGGESGSTVVQVQMRETQGRKKVVDTRASKGRKMRFTVHEKLRDFMVPDDRNRWNEEQAVELFRGLLGGRGLREDESEGEEEEVQGLRLF